jgi:hypothetical protein
MIAKTGDIMTWHWAHAAAPGNCAYSGESEWHLAWKARGLDGTQETWRHDFSRRADVYAPAGFAVEFQRSRLSKAEVIARERDWHYRIVWIFDVTAAYRAGAVELGPDTLTSWNTPEMIMTAVKTPRYAPGVRTFLDLGDGMLWYAECREPLYAGGKWNSKEQLIHGFPVPEDSVVKNVLHARSATALAAMGLRIDLWLPLARLAAP